MRALPALSLEYLGETAFGNTALLSVAGATEGLASGHQSRNARDHDIILRGRRRGDADDQACGRNNAVIRSKNRRPQPAYTC